MDMTGDGLSKKRFSSEGAYEAFENYYYGWYLNRAAPLGLAFGLVLAAMAAIGILLAPVSPSGPKVYMIVMTVLFGALLFACFFYLRQLVRGFEWGEKRTMADILPSAIILVYAVVIGSAGEIQLGPATFLMGAASLLIVPRARPILILGFCLAGAFAFVALKAVNGAASAELGAILLECLAGTSVVLLIGYLMYNERSESFDEKYRLTLANKALKCVADTDYVTGLASSRKSDMLFTREWERARRQKESIAVAVIDIDSFKAFNERMGKSLADEFLVLTAAVLRKCARRRTDFLARNIKETSMVHGGDEFLVLLPRTDREGAMKVAEAIIGEIRSVSMTDGSGNYISCPTASIGIAAMVPGDDTELKELMQKAEKALAAAKQAGGDTCRTA